jgi:hypothetical protein
MLFRLGFDVVRNDVKWKFTFIKAVKSERNPNWHALNDISPSRILD